MHHGLEQTGPSDEMFKVQSPQFRNRDEAEIIVDFACFVRAAGIEGVRVACILGELFDEVVEEGTPFWCRAELGNEEGVLLAAFVGGEEHAAVFAPGDGAEVDGGLDGCPGRTVCGVPDLDDAFVGGEDFVGGGYAGGAGGGFEESQCVDGVAVALVFAEERDGRAEVVKMDEAC